MVGLGRHFQHFQLDVGTHRGKDMIALGRYGTVSNSVEIAKDVKSD